MEKNNQHHGCATRLRPKQQRNDEEVEKTSAYRKRMHHRVIFKKWLQCGDLIFGRQKDVDRTGAYHPISSAFDQTCIEIHDPDLKSQQVQDPRGNRRDVPTTQRVQRQSRSRGDQHQDECQQGE